MFRFRLTPYLSSNSVGSKECPGTACWTRDFASLNLSNNGIPINYTTIIVVNPRLSDETKLSSKTLLLKNYSTNKYFHTDLYYIKLP